MATADINNTILVVEEDARMAFLLDYLLSREGYKVIAINPGHQNHIMQQGNMTPRLIIMGNKASVENDSGMISDIRNQDDWKNVPILVLVSNYEKQKMERAMQAGANDFLMQPFDQRELMMQVERHMVSMH